MQHVGQNCPKVVIEFHAWEPRKKAGDGSEFGCLPQVLVKKGAQKIRMAKFTAIMHSFGIRYGFYDPNDWKTARYCDPIVDCWGDEINLLRAWLFAHPD